jgi:transaldolase
MSKINELEKIKIFYDGNNIEKYSKNQHVRGYTTNISFLKQAGITDYKQFALEKIKLANGKPISFQVFAKDLSEMESQAREISSWAENVYVKIPVVNSEGESSVGLVKKLNNEGMKINITTVYTTQQIEKIWESLKQTKTPTIVSIFSGRISDTGVYPEPIVKQAVELYSENSNIEVLWAGCQRVLNIFDAVNVGCQIITVPDAPMDRINRIGKNLHEFSVETSKSFRQDGLDAKLVL